MTKIAHIINPVEAEPGSRFRFIQEVTFQTMKSAREYSQHLVEVDFVSVQYPEDHKVIPPYFSRSQDITRSILDINDFKFRKKYPLIQDILTLGCQVTDADFIVFSNVDIHLQPYFYQAVHEMIMQGFEGIVINRRSISSEFSNLTEIPIMYTKIGEPHRGWDCFVFRREKLSLFRLGEVCIGVPMVGLVLLSNLIAYSEKFIELKRDHLTFHLGNDRSWSGSDYSDYLEHNKIQALKILRYIHQDIDGFPDNSAPAIFLRNMNNPIRKFLYESFRRIHIPVKYTNIFKGRSDNH